LALGDHSGSQEYPLGLELAAQGIGVVKKGLDLAVVLIVQALDFGLGLNVHGVALQQGLGIYITHALGRNGQ
jgi:hypothetical protein